MDLTLRLKGDERTHLLVIWTSLKAGGWTLHFRQTMRIRAKVLLILDTRKIARDNVHLNRYVLVKAVSAGTNPDHQFPLYQIMTRETIHKVRAPCTEPSVSLVPEL